MKLTKRWSVLIGLMPCLLCAGDPATKSPPQPARPPQLSSVLLDSQGKRVTSKAHWARQRAFLKSQWQAVLGEFPKAWIPLKTQVLATEELSGFTRQWVKYQVEEDLFTDGYLLMPPAVKARLPGVVVFHPTTPAQAKGVAGLDPAYPVEKWQGVQLVQRGFVVWCPRNYINTEGGDWQANAAAVLQRHPDWTGMTRMVWDAIRAADFMQSLATVDPQRIGCLGHSLGAKEVLFAMAFDERYRAGVSSEGGIGLTFSNWEAPWYLGPGIRNPGFGLENHQVLALVAPRPFLLLAGDSADDNRSYGFIKAVAPVYELLGAPDHLRWFNHHLGHVYPPEVRARAEAFLDEYLQKRRD